MLQQTFIFFYCGISLNFSAKTLQENATYFHSDVNDHTTRRSAWLAAV